MQTHVIEAARFNRSVCLVSILRCILFPRRHKTTEGRGFRQRRSTPFSYRDRCLLDPRVDPPNTRVVASQTRLVAPQADLCRRRVVSFPACAPLNTPRHRVVTPVVTSLSSSPMPSWGIPHVVCVGSQFRKVRATYFEKTCKLIDVEKEWTGPWGC